MLDLSFKADKSIAEFYVKPKYRRLGIGKATAYQLFKKYKGKWEIRQKTTNKNAHFFWRSIIADYTIGNYIEVIHGEKETALIMQLFSTI